jgi:hypothetical protein
MYKNNQFSLNTDVRKHFYDNENNLKGPEMYVSAIGSQESATALSQVQRVPWLPYANMH